jgi:hypothetical protein
MTFIILCLQNYLIEQSRMSRWWFKTRFSRVYTWHLYNPTSLASHLIISNQQHQYQDLRHFIHFTLKCMKICLKTTNIVPLTMWTLKLHLPTNKNMDYFLNALFHYNPNVMKNMDIFFFSWTLDSILSDNGI